MKNEIGLQCTYSPTHGNGIALLKMPILSFPFLSAMPVIQSIWWCDQRQNWLLATCAAANLIPTRVAINQMAGLVLYVTPAFSNCRCCHDVPTSNSYCTEFISFPTTLVERLHTHAANTLHTSTPHSLYQELAVRNLSIWDRYFLINWLHHHSNRHLALHLQPFIIQSY